MLTYFWSQRIAERLVKRDFILSLSDVWTITLPDDIIDEHIDYQCQYFDKSWLHILKLSKQIKVHYYILSVVLLLVDDKTDMWHRCTITTTKLNMVECDLCNHWFHW